MEQNLSGTLLDEVETLKFTSQVLLQRHGKSVANEAYEKILDLSNAEEVEAWIWNPELRDPRLSQTGNEQWVEVQKVVNALNIHTIFVSPLRRTLETAYYTYRAHPNFDKIKFILLPSIRESLNTSSDVPSNVDELIREFKDLLPNLDSSLLDQMEDKRLYFIHDLQQDVRDRIKWNLVEKAGDPLGSNVFDLFVKEAKAAFPGRLESKWNVYDRSVKSKKFIKKYIEENKIPQDHKVVVLAHFIYFYMHTGKWNWPCDRDKELSYPSEFIRMKNCQIVPDPTDYNSLEL